MAETNRRGKVGNRKSSRIFIYLIVILVICGIVLALLALNVGLFKSIDGVTNESEVVEIISRRENFTISLIASGLEDLVFFIIIGFAIFVYAMRKPQEESLENRVWYLFSGDHASAEAREWSKNRINKLACISPKSSIHLTLDSYHENLGAFRISTDWDFHIANMYGNQDFEEQNHFEVDVDPVNPPGGIYGQVQKMRTIYPDLSKEVEHIDRPINIGKTGFQKQVSLQLPPNGIAIYSSRYWHFSKEDVGYWLQVNRYTQSLTVTLTNLLDCTVCYRRTGDADQPVFEIQPEQRVELFLGLAEPDKRVLDLFFTKKKLDDALDKKIV